MKENSLKGLYVIIFVLVILVIGLGGYIVFNKSAKLNNNDNNDNNDDNMANVVANNVTIVTSTCNDGCTKNIKDENEEDVSLYVTTKELRLGDKAIISLEEDSANHLDQVSIYNDIIIAMEGFSLKSHLTFYDLKGNKLKTIAMFNDEEGRIFTAYPRYSEEELFHVDNDGKITFVGTKHPQGQTNSYIDDNGSVIDLCDVKNVSDNDIVSGLFTLSYLGKGQFSDISYVSTKSTVKDIKACN